jgi:hypothetical protein
LRVINDQNTKIFGRYGPNHGIAMFEQDLVVFDADVGRRLGDFNRTLNHGRGRPQEK